MDVITAGVIVLISIIILILISFRDRYKAKGESFVGPPGLPFFGSYRDVDPSIFHHTMDAWFKQYGDVFCFKMFSKTFFVLSSYDVIYEAIVTKVNVTGLAPVNFRSLYMSRNQSDILYSDTYHPWWLPLRKAFHRSTRLFAEGLRTTEDIFARATDDLVVKFASYHGQGRSVDIRTDLTDFTVRAALALLTGQRQTDEQHLARIEKSRLMAEKLIAALGTANFHGALLDAFPVVRHFGNPVFKLLSDAERLADDLFDEIRAETQVTYEVDENKCLMHALFQLMDKNSVHYNPEISEINLKAAFGDALTASMGTTSSVLYALFNILLHHPKVIRKLKEEIDKVVGRSRLPSLEDRDKMPYTTAVIYETLRYVTVVPMFAHVTKELTTIGGREFPANAFLLLNLWTLHHRDDLWKNPWAFEPERYLDENGNLLPAEHPHRKHLLAFGAGPRVCVGELFALRRMFYVITHVLHEFDLQPANEMTSCDPRDYDFGIVLQPPSYKINFIARNITLE